MSVGLKALSPGPGSSSSGPGPSSDSAAVEEAGPIAEGIVSAVDVTVALPGWEKATRQEERGLGWLRRRAAEPAEEVRARLSFLPCVSDFCFLLAWSGNVAVCGTVPQAFRPCNDRAVVDGACGRTLNLASCPQAPESHAQRNVMHALRSSVVWGFMHRNDMATSRLLDRVGNPKKAKNQKKVVKLKLPSMRKKPAADNEQ